MLHDAHLQVRHQQQEAGVSQLGPIQPQLPQVWRAGHAHAYTLDPCRSEAGQLQEAHGQQTTAAGKSMCPQSRFLLITELHIRSHICRQRYVRR